MPGSTFHRRFHSLVKGTCLALLLVSVVALLLSLVWQVTLYRSGWAAGWGYGCISVQSTNPTMGTPQDDWRFATRRSGQPLVRAWWVKIPRPRPGVWAVVVPLWIPMVVLGIATFLVWRRYRRLPVGHCQGCGYDLTSNVSGVCPECGRSR